MDCKFPRTYFLQVSCFIIEMGQKPRPSYHFRLRKIVFSDLCNHIRKTEILLMAVFGCWVVLFTNNFFILLKNKCYVYSYQVRNDLMKFDNVILYKSRMVIPKSLRRKVYTVTVTCWLMFIKTFQILYDIYLIHIPNTHQLKSKYNDPLLLSKYESKQMPICTSKIFICQVR